MIMIMRWIEAFRVNSSDEVRNDGETYSQIPSPIPTSSFHAQNQPLDQDAGGVPRTFEWGLGFYFETGGIFSRRQVGNE